MGFPSIARADAGRLTQALERMAICPHCDKDTIGLLAKLSSIADRPARCEACGGLSFLQSHSTLAGRMGNLLFAVLVAAPVLAIGAAVAAGTWLAGLVVAAILALLAAGHFVSLHRRPLSATFPAETVTARRWQTIWAALWLVGAISALAVSIYRTHAP